MSAHRCALPAIELIARSHQGQGGLYGVEFLVAHKQHGLVHCCLIVSNWSCVQYPQRVDSFAFHSLTLGGVCSLAVAQRQELSFGRSALVTAWIKALPGPQLFGVGSSIQIPMCSH